MERGGIFCGDYRFGVSALFSLALELLQVIVS